jgi:polysaccharide pyruvyl transferase WcaK-like protein
MRILIDQSGYDLRNIGDIAMLQVCVDRLASQFPDSHIDIICRPEANLADISPTCHRVTFNADNVPVLRTLPSRRRKTIEQIHKILAPKFHRASVRTLGAGRPGSIRHSLEHADIVVASGGGFVTDPWWWHALGVLNVLAAAQELGKPTAMFGQGVGPISNPHLRRALRMVVPNLNMIGLRESRQSKNEVTALGARAEQLRVTGDDALEIALTSEGPTLDGTDLGVNIRVAKYAGVDDSRAATIGDAVMELVSDWGCSPRPLPVSFNADAPDAATIDAHFPATHNTSGGSALATRPVEFRDTIAHCRAIITGSYHAAVFGLAQGIPTTTLVMSDYYAAKFYGLRDLFPEGCRVVDCRGSMNVNEITDVLEQSWHADTATRQATFSRAVSQVTSSRSCYKEFFAQLT